MTKAPRPRYQDIQPPKLYRTGCTLRRGYATGPADTPEERAMTGLLNQADRGR